MNRILTMLCFALVYITGQAQNLSKYSLRNEHFDGNSYVLTRADTLCNPQKFINARQWAVNTFEDYKNVIQVEDSQNGRLFIKGVLPVQSYYGANREEYYTPLLRFTLTIDIKSEKYRMRFEDMSILLIKEVRLGTMKHSSNNEMSLSEFMKTDVPGQQNKDNLSSALTGLINSAMKSITLYDDF